MTTIRAKDFKRDPQWADRHLEFAIESARQIFTHIQSLPDRDFLCEYRKLIASTAADPQCPGTRMVREIYLREITARKLPFSHEVANENVPSVPF